MLAHGLCLNVVGLVWHIRPGPGSAAAIASFVKPLLAVQIKAKRTGLPPLRERIWCGL